MDCHLHLFDDTSSFASHGLTTNNELLLDQKREVFLQNDLRQLRQRLACSQIQPSCKDSVRTFDRLAESALYRHILPGTEKLVQILHVVRLIPLDS